MLELVGPRPAGEPLPAPDVRRPAAACRARPRARDRAERAPARRAAVGARCQGAAPAPRGDPAHPDHDRHHDPVRDPRPGGGPRDGRPGRRDVGRATRADRATDRALRPPEDALRGRVRRPDQPHPRDGDGWRRRPPRDAASRCSRARRDAGRSTALVRPGERPARPGRRGTAPRRGRQLPRLPVPRPGHPAGRDDRRRPDVGVRREGALPRAPPSRQRRARPGLRRRRRDSPGRACGPRRDQITEAGSDASTSSTRPTCWSSEADRADCPRRSPQPVPAPRRPSSTGTAASAGT